MCLSQIYNGDGGEEVLHGRVSRNTVGAGGLSLTCRPLDRQQLTGRWAQCSQLNRWTELLLAESPEDSEFWGGRECCRRRWKRRRVLICARQKSNEQKARHIGRKIRKGRMEWKDDLNQAATSWLVLGIVRTSTAGLLSLWSSKGTIKRGHGRRGGEKGGTVWVSAERL